MIITLNSLSAILCISVSLNSFSEFIFPCFLFCLSFCICFYGLGEMATSPNVEEVILACNVFCADSVCLVTFAGAIVAVYASYSSKLWHFTERIKKKIIEGKKEENNKKEKEKK